MRDHAIHAARRWLAKMVLAALPGLAASEVTPWLAVSEATLAQWRGGAALPATLQLTVDVTRMVALNGEVLASAGMTFDGQSISGSAADNAGGGALHPLMPQAEGGRIAAWPSRAPDAGAATSSVHVVLPGFAPAAPVGGAALVLQNAVNGQDIRSMTLINASVNSATLLGNIQFQRQLSDALARTVTMQ